MFWGDLQFDLQCFAVFRLTRAEQVDALISVTHNGLTIRYDTIYLHALKSGLA